MLLAEDELTNYTFHLTYFNIWRGGPPGRRTYRPIWQAQSAHAHV